MNQPTEQAADAAGMDHAAGELRILPITGLPEFRPGDDLAEHIAAGAPSWPTATCSW